MDPLALLAQLAIFTISPLVHLRVGKLLWNFLKKTPIGKKSTSQPRLSLLYFPGLAIQIYLILALKSFGASWVLTAAISILPFLFPLKETRLTINSLIPKSLSLNFALWILVVLYLGISLADTTQSVTTIWVNTYGDLAYHMGMISSFAIGDNFPPQNQILSGTPLSYPFFVNLWAASLWWANPVPGSFNLVLLAQWMTIWVTLYFVVDGDRFKFLPWAVLFGGGSLARLGTHSGENIKSDYPWSVFLTTIWIPQRSAMMGMLGGLTALRYFNDFIKDPANRFHLLCTGSIIALLPLVHTHLFLVICLYIGGTILLRFRLRALTPLRIFSTAAVFSLISLPWLFGKQSIFKFEDGWYPWKSDISNHFLSSLVGSAEMWFFNAGHWFLLIIILWFLTKAHAHFITLCALFIAGNIFHLAVWEWDQIKIFMSLYLIFLSLWMYEPNAKKLILGHYILIVGMIAGVAELGLVLIKYNRYTIYSVDDVTKAKELISATAPDSVFIAAPLHNSMITLTGRKLFMGFPGTLYSHGALYKDREQMMSSLTQVVNCSGKSEFKSAQKKICPDYLLWTGNEQAKWRMIDPKSALKLRPTELPYLYKVQ